MTNKAVVCLNNTGALSREILTWLHVNNKGADQIVHRCSLISAFVIRSLASITVVLALLAICKTLIFIYSLELSRMFESDFVRNTQDRVSRVKAN